MGDSPYKFLDYYDIDDQDIFFGRERETRILVADVLVNRLVVLFARTGTGKTSLINAGVRPQLEARDFATFWIRVERDPTEAARDDLQKKGLLRDNLREASLTTQLGAVVEALNRPIVLFFDQFEEFFVHIGDRTTRSQFIAAIAELYRNAESGVHVVFSLREEYFHEMDEFRSEIPSIFHKNSNLRLRPFDEVQAREAIVKPAATRSVEVEPSLVDELIRDLWQEEGIMPTGLQIVCDTLWSKPDRAQDRITLEDYRQLGGARSIYDWRLEQDIKAALPDDYLVTLMERLLPELRTERNTKYPRVLSDLEKILNTDLSSLQALVARLREIHVIRTVTISGADAIEWTSDYLAERTDNLMRQVNAIGLRRLLTAAMARAAKLQDSVRGSLAASDTERGHIVAETDLESLYLPAEDFERLSQGIGYLGGLSKEEAAFLFQAALFHRNHMALWYGQARLAGVDPWGVLREKLHDREAHISQRQGAVSLLAELGTEQALSVLEEALDEPDLALETVYALGEVPGDRATELLGTALERDDLWDAVVLTLTRVRSPQAVLLLEPLLQQEQRSLTARTALERLAASSGGQVTELAQEALERSLPVRQEEQAPAGLSPPPTRAMATGERGWDQFQSLVRHGRVTPIIGSATSESSVSNTALARRLAEEFDYPLQDRDNLARVLEYLEVSLSWSYARSTLVTTLEELTPQPSPDTDVFDVLAQLPLPIYVTSSFENRMTQALQRAGKKPQRDQFRWNRKMESLRGPAEDYYPSPLEPLVYHLYGVLDLPDSLVLTQDDLIAFTVGFASDRELVPAYVRRALVDTGLLFLGYDPFAADFRTILGLLNASEGRFLRKRYSHTIVLPVPEDPGATNYLQPLAGSYLQSYFEVMDMNVYWGTAGDFARELAARWEKYADAR